MKRHYLVLAVGVVCVSFAAIFIRLAEAPPLVIAAFRLGLASLLIIPVAIARSRDELRRLSRREVLLALLSGVFLAAHFVLWITSLGLTSVASSVVLVTANPIFVAVGSYLLFKERLGKYTLTGIGISLVGAIIIGFGNWQQGAFPLWGAIMALAGALTVAGYMLIGRRLRRNMGLLSYISLSYGTAAVILILSVFIAGYGFSGYSGTTYLMLVLLAVVPQIIGHSSLNWSLRYVPATLLTVAVLGEPVGATLAAFFILSETPLPVEIIGGVLILLGIYIAFRKNSSSLGQD